MTPRPAQVGVAAVRARYDAFAADLRSVAERPPGDPELAAGVAAFLHAEARLLDAGRFSAWLDLVAEDGTVWVPLRADAHPASDQSLFLDDRRRLGERVWRLADPSAWALQPPPWVTRLVGGVEAWPAEPVEEGGPGGGDEVLAAATLVLQHARGGRVWSGAGRTVHRLRRGPTGWRIVTKIIAMPAPSAGVPHLGWLL